MIRERVVLIPEKDDGSFGTLYDLLKFQGIENIPMRAIIQYAGCGSHRIEFSWEEDDGLDEFGSVKLHDDN